MLNRKDVAKPDVAPHPLCRCDTCGDVPGVQWWKKPQGTLTASGRHFQVGKYGRYGQYLYRCPNVACRHSIVTPYERTAQAGNAVTASVACWLGQRCAEALNRTAAA